MGSVFYERNKKKNWLLRIAGVTKGGLLSFTEIYGRWIMEWIESILKETNEYFPLQSALGLTLTEFMAGKLGSVLFRPLILFLAYLNFLYINDFEEFGRLGKEINQKTWIYLKILFRKLTWDSSVGPYFYGLKNIRTFVKLLIAVANKTV